MPDSANPRALRLEKLFDVPVVIASLLVVPVLVIDGGDYAATWESMGRVLNWGTWLVFLAESVVLIAVSDNRRAWLRSHPIDVAVVVLTPPFFSALAPLRLLRFLRLLRLFRVARFARRAFSDRGLQYSAALAALTAVAGGAAFSTLAEHERSTTEGMYWALSTMTTVGAEGIAPDNTTTKILSLAVMLVGIGFVAILTGAIAQRFVKENVAEEAHEIELEFDETSTLLLGELREIRTRLDTLEGALVQRAQLSRDAGGP